MPELTQIYVTNMETDKCRLYYDNQVFELLNKELQKIKEWK
jgi:hypothetical protein